MIGPMSLYEFVERLDSFDDELTVFRKPNGDLTRESLIFLINVDEEEEEAQGLKEFIDVWHIRDVIEGKSKLTGMANPDVPTKLQLLLDYAENGA